MKTVFPNKMVAHVWAQRKQAEGRSNNGNLWFNGATLYSYRTPIARFVDGTALGTVALISSVKYSTTTAVKHLPAAYRAVNCRVFRVPTLAESWSAGRGNPTDHTVNLAHLVETYSKEVARLKRATKYGLNEHSKERLDDMAQEARLYAAAFELSPPAICLERDLETIEAAQNTPSRIASRAKAARLEAERQRLAALGKAEKIAAWYAGEPVSVYFDAACGGAALRIVGDTLQTSHGADVPLAHAVKAFRFIKLVRERAEGWQHNGHSLRVGHFTVDSIAPDGSFRAGCHDIRWPEIERVAILAGVFHEKADDAALTLTSHAA